ncbi:hypothetical protein F443_09693 [Plasmopara halstedii]|uniref:FYVE-type domain-containing protein n=1 Tax=Plasmopara halstedii TaxID=4781 RepID=A0A0P1AWU9_PLAHL|nr:hypothetical protein F443_09693 [Plasmopara halstedii]CEG45516.1 hypothetical protein F443_09693 [Plasmopara halstedii]|eukprot:XP_024581885.1 hypothetical protein F443_09693 [Plasmopara halstedii]
MPSSNITKLTSSAPLLKSASSKLEHLSLTSKIPKFLELTDQVKNKLRKQIATAVEDVLDSMMHEGTEDVYWRAKMRKDSITYYEDKESVTKEQKRFCCVDNTEASVKEVIKLFVVSDTETLLQRCRIMYDNIMDARVLTVLEHPSSDFPMRSCYIRYTAFKTKSIQRNNRDMCVVVSTNVVKFPDGSTVGYCVWDSLNLSEISKLDIPPGFIRTRMFRSGYFVQNSGQPGALTKIVYIVGIEAGGLAPRLTTRYYMPRFAEVLGRIIEHLRTRPRLDSSSFVPKSQWTDKQKVEFCQCCSKYFGAVKLLDTRRYNCMACGDAICHACHHLEVVEDASGRQKTVGICVGCRSTPSHCRLIN